MAFMKILLPRIATALLLTPLLAMSVHAADLRIALSADVTSADPHLTNITPNNTAGWHVYDALTHVDADTRLVPGLAESWRAVDATTWEFRLRKGVKFHDGTDLTAEDVVFSVERAAKLQGGQFAGFVSRMVAREVVNPLTVRFRTAQPYAMVPHDLNSIFIVSKRAVGSASPADFDSGKAAIGTGPFRFIRFARGDRVELAKNPSYWGGGTAWDRVTLRIIPSDPTRLAALVSGDVDMIEAIPTTDAVRLRSNAGFALAQKVSWRTLFFHLDQARDKSPFVTDKSGRPLDRNPLRDARVRLAISKAINRQAIAERVMEGLAVPASNLVSPPVFGHAADIKPEVYDPEGAKKLLAEAGFPDGFGLTLHAPNNRYVNDDQIAQTVAQMLSRAGIATRVDTMPVNVYLTRARNNEFSMAMLGWGSFSADLALRALVATSAPEKGFGAWNWSRYSNPKLDSLLEQGFALTDDRRRETMARDAMRMAMRGQAVIPLHHQIATWAMKRGLVYAGRTDEYTFARDVRPR